MATRYDRTGRRAAVRKQAERGCWLYVPEEELRRAGVPSGELPPLYRLWGQPRGGLLVRLYRRPQ